MILPNFNTFCIDNPLPMNSPCKEWRSTHTDYFLYIVESGNKLKAIEGEKYQLKPGYSWYNYYEAAPNSKPFNEYDFWKPLLYKEYDDETKTIKVIPY